MEAELESYSRGNVSSWFCEVMCVYLFHKYTLFFIIEHSYKHLLVIINK